MDWDTFTHMTWIRDELIKLRERYPDDPAIDSCIAQMDYLIALETGEQSDDSRLEEIILGHHAVRSLADIINQELSEAMCQLTDSIRGKLRLQGRRMLIDRR